MLDLTGVVPSQELADKLFPCQYIGPSWQMVDGAWHLPRRTLGWEILGWCAQWLTTPDGEPWIFTPEQARIVLWLYEIDEHGQRVYRKGVMQRAKGHGKDPFAAALCLVELMGPCKFSHFDDAGNPVAKERRDSWVQLAATTTEQNKNTMLLIPSMLPKYTREQFQLDVQKQIIHIKGTGRRLEAVSSNFAGLEGARPTFALLNETHHWQVSRGGDELYQVIRNNVQKVEGWFLCITNAYQPGQGSVAEEIRLAVMREREGLAADTGWFFDSVEAHPDAPMYPGTPDGKKGWSYFILKRVYGDSWWVKLENIVSQSLMDTSVPVSKLRRMFFNQVVASEDAMFSEGEWDGVKAPFAVLKPGDEIVAGFDGGKTDDATALVVMRLKDRVLFPIHIWQKPDGPEGDNWHIDEEQVEGMVHMIFREYVVRAFYADVALWESYIASWSDEYREVLLIKASPNSAIGFDMRGNQAKITRANEAFLQMVVDKMIFHNGDPLLRRHALNAKRHENQWGVTFRKASRESPHKVDGYAAALLCSIAANDLAESGAKPKPAYTRRLYQF